AIKIKFLPAENILKQFRIFNRYLIPYWSLEALVLLIVLITSILGLLGPALAGVTIDKALLQHDLYIFKMLLLISLILSVSLAIFSIIQNYLTAYIGRMVTFDLRRDYIRHLFRLSFPDFHRRSTGEQLYRLDSDLSTAAGLASETIPRILITISRLLFLTGICLYLEWRLTLIAFLIGPFFYLHSRYFGRKQKKVTRSFKEASQDSTTMIQDALANIKLIKAFGRERGAVLLYLHHRLRIIRFGLRRVRITMAGNLTAGLLNSVVLLGFTYYLGFQVIRGSLSLGELVALTIYLTQLFVSIKGMGGLYRDVMVKMVSWDRVRETLSLPSREENTSAIPLPDPRGRISCRAVSFDYRPEERTLSDITLQIYPGQFVGLVGPSGSGKTTLLMLLLRLIDPGKGEIKIDGHNLKDIRWSSLRPFVGIALQEAFLLNRSIADNLRFGQTEASEDEMWKALVIADLDGTVRKMEEGLATVVGEAGSRLSEGQQQRLNIARAVIGRPRILILDEATSAVGFDSESRILSRIREKLVETTIIFATHRLNSLTEADQIIVLNEGKLVETGTHKELIKIDGFYRTLSR
ncbi:MAG: ABC transporter ATP-binding protein, partial [Candidatus Auribacterota bacterium]|nr:ABC transporter ATP-binding protein [Candidatus Auribacterota bacterium]